MKKILVAFFVFSSLMTFAQKKEVIYKKLAEKSCECINKKGTNISEAEIGFCLLESLNSLEEKEQKVIGYVGEKRMNALEKISENIGVEMAMTCPQVFINMKDENGESLIGDEGSKKDATIEGTIEEIAANEFAKIKLKDDKNNLTEFIWLKSFGTDSILLNGKVVKGDKVQISYVEEQLYDANSKSYKAYKIISGIKFL